MKSLVLVTILTLFNLIVAGQKTKTQEYAAIDKSALSLPDSLTETTDEIAAFITANFTSESDKARAIFIWVASNIQYDIDNMFAFNFYETSEGKIVKTLKAKKGVCDDYALLFTEISKKTGIKSYVIEGYTKQTGFSDYLSHAWSASFIDSSWFLFDPTWGSGYINGEKFVRLINNDYYKVSPATLITTHIPFDYLWQFLNYPITNQEFYEGKTQTNTTKPYFNYIDSLASYENMDAVEKAIASAYRIEKNGVRNSLVFEKLHRLKSEIENDRQNKAVNLFNSAINDYNAGINKFNDFIHYRNKQFTPAKSDPEIQEMLDEPEEKMKQASQKLGQIENPDANMQEMIQEISQSIQEANQYISEQQKWLKEYFSKSKFMRKSMFYDTKVTWFGIPLN
jgi:hypothetical protein